MSTVYDKDGVYLGKLGDVFGDPTRRGIYRHLRECEEPKSASEVADVFGLHRTVARAHLEKLCELGLVTTGTRRRPTGGRPAKTYEISDGRLEVMLPPRRYERLSRLLLRMLDRTLDPAEAAAAAESLGRTYGEETAAEIAAEGAGTPVKLSPGAVLKWMEDAGYSATLIEPAAPGEPVVLEVQNCVYRELALEFPDIVCCFDQGMFRGMLGVDAEAHRRTHALSAGDEFCRHEFTV